MILACLVSQISAVDKDEQLQKYIYMTVRAFGDKLGGTDLRPRLCGFAVPPARRTQKTLVIAA